MRCTIVLLLIIMVSSCKDANVYLEEYPKYTDYGRNSSFAIDSVMSNNIYMAEEEFYNGSNNVSRFYFYVRDDKFFAKLIEPESNYFILFDLKSKLGSVNKIVVKNAKMIKSFDCILEKKVKTKEALEVGVFRIKKWFKLPDFFGGEQIDVVFFVTQKYGVIGSYLSDIDESGIAHMIEPEGDVLKEYVDYSNVQESLLE